MKDYRDINSYSYGSVAYDYEIDDRREEVNRFDVRIEKRRGLSKKNPLSFLGKIFLSVSVMAVISCFVSLLYQYVTITYNQKIITNLKEEIKTVEAELNSVEGKREEVRDLANIKQKAIGKLGMVYPSDNQVGYFTVPNEDYTKNY